MKLLTAVFICLLAPVCTAATIYKYVDQDGHVTYSNIPVRGAQAVNIRLQPDNGSLAKPRQGGSASVAPSTFPSVAPSTQKQRDSGRRQILQSELANEQNALDQARKALMDSETRLKAAASPSGEQQARLGTLRETIKDRERNVAALQKELGQAN